jgi:hypothetical protein
MIKPSHTISNKNHPSRRGKEGIRGEDQCPYGNDVQKCKCTNKVKMENNEDLPRGAKV